MKKLTALFAFVTITALALSACSPTPTATQPKSVAVPTAAGLEKAGIWTQDYITKVPPL